MMIRNMLKKLGSTLYIQVWENRIKVTDVLTGEIYDQAPLVSIETNAKGQKIVTAVGNEVKGVVAGGEIQVVNPFSHSRMLLNDFFVAEKLVQHIIHSLLATKFISPSPLVVIHPMEKVEGGLTMIEKKAFTELALGAGAREAVLHEGPVLSASTFDFEKIKANNCNNVNTQILLKPKKENYLALVFGVAVILGVLWLSY